MKKLILIQNDYPSTGKSTLSQCFSRYLSQYGVQHRLMKLVDDIDACEEENDLLDGSLLTTRSLMEVVNQHSVTMLEISTGMSEFFMKFYHNHQVSHTLQAAGVATSVVLPVTSESDSFDAVIEAAEVYSDEVEYLIAHLITSSYEDDDKIWDRSYAARVMDMFEAVELHIPEIGFQIEMELRTQHKELSVAIMDPESGNHHGKDFTKWINRIMGQVDSARQYLFGEAFKPTTKPKIETKKSAVARAL